MSKSDNLSLINFLANKLYIESKEVGEAYCLWLCLDYRIRARYILEARALFECWVLRETIAREAREGNISIKDI